MIIVFSILVVPNVFASSPFVISEEKAGGYQYTVIKEKNTFTWIIGCQDTIFTMEENNDNTEGLKRFRIAVEDINSKIFKLIISASYFLIVVITTLILYKNNKKMFKDGGTIIVTLAVIALYNMFVTSIDLNTAFQDANYYYLLLIK